MKISAVWCVLSGRWQGAAGTLMNSAAMVKDITTMADSFAPPADRCLPRARKSKFTSTEWVGRSWLKL